MLKTAALAALLATAAFQVPAKADNVLDKVRSTGFVRCASVPRPGLAADNGKGNWKGLEVEICRAIAVAALGPQAKFAYRALGSDTDFDGVRAGEDQVVFLTFSEMQAQHLTDKLVPGPTVFLESHGLLVAADSPARRPEDLAGQSICSLTGTPADASVDAYFGEHKIAVQHRPYSEDGEMFDAFRVQSCKAVASEATSLAQERLDGGINRLQMRLLEPPLHVFPVVAATPIGGDSGWAAIVGWTMNTLMAADRAETEFRAGGLRALPVAGTGLGLRDDWQKSVVDVVGNYDSIFRRTLGADTPLKLPLDTESGSRAAPNTD